MSLVKQLTMKGAGIGMMGEKIVKDEKNEGTLVQVLHQLNLPKVTIYLLFPQKQLPKRISTFAQEIREGK